MVIVDPKKNSDWLEELLGGVRDVGYAIAVNVLKSSFIDQARAAMYRVQERILANVGPERLSRAGELGVLRLMPKFDDFFIQFLEIPELLSVIDHTVSQVAVLHTQNGFILPPCQNGEVPQVFQNSFHQDFPRVFNGYMVSVNAMFAIDDFSQENGATLVVPGTHQKWPPPDSDYLKANAVPVVCLAGSMVVFDSTLWHAAGINTSGRDRLAVNHQFTGSYIKQQIDYVRALGDDMIIAQKPRTQQLLGWYTRVVTSLDEYYRNESERLYRKGQG